MAAMLQFKKKRYLQPQQLLGKGVHPLVDYYWLPAVNSLGFNQIANPDGLASIPIPVKTGIGLTTVASKRDFCVVMVFRSPAAASSVELLRVSTSGGTDGFRLDAYNSGGGVYASWTANGVANGDNSFRYASINNKRIVLVSDWNSTGQTSWMQREGDQLVTWTDTLGFNITSNGRIDFGGATSPYLVEGFFILRRNVGERFAKEILENPWQLLSDSKFIPYVAQIIPAVTKFVFNKKKKINKPVYADKFSPEFNVVSAFVPGIPKDLVRDTPISRQTNTAYVNDADGIAIKGTSTTATKINLGSNGLSDMVGTTGPVSYLVRFKLSTLGINQFIMTSMDSSGYEGVSIQVNTSNQLQLSWRDQSGGTVKSIAGTLPNNLGWHTVLLTTDPSWGIVGFLDGTLFGTNSLTDVARRSTGRTAYLGPGEYSADFLNSDATIAFGAVIKQDLRQLGKELTLNPWKILSAKNHLVFLPESITVYRPSSDAAVTSWTGVPNSTLYENINETIYDDAGYIQSPDLSTPEVFGLSASLPVGSYDVKIRASSNSSGQIRIKLLDSSDVTVGTSSWQSVTGLFDTYTLSVTTTGTATKVKIEVQ